MNCDIEYQAWCVLDALPPLREIEERKQRIIHCTLARIERATRESHAGEIAELHRLETEYGPLLPWHEEPPGAPAAPATPSGCAGERDETTG